MFINLFCFILNLIYLSKEKLPETKIDNIQSDERDDYPYTFSAEIKKTYSPSQLVRDDKRRAFNEKLTSKELIKELGFGWNLANSFDAHDGFNQNQGVKSEECWGNPITTRNLIENISKKFKAIRIPITWHNHLIDKYYSIDREWMNKIKEIVDICIEKGLYVIINMQNDNAFHENIKYGEGFYPSRKDIKISENFLYNIWRQITITFNSGYDEHLIFECFNQPRLSGTEIEYLYKKGDTKIEQAVSIINEYLRLVVKTIRDSGLNNEKRFIIVTPLLSDINTTLFSDFNVPGDNKYDNRILVGLNYFKPEYFAYENNDDHIYEQRFNLEFYGFFKALYEKFILRNIYVIITEMGAVNKNNNEDRIKWGNDLIENAKNFYIPCFLWDNNNFDNSLSYYDTFGYFNRKNYNWEIKEIIDSMILSSKQTREHDPFHEHEHEMKIKNVNNILKDIKNFEFKNDTKYISLNIGILSSFNLYNKIVMEVDKLKPGSKENELFFMLGDGSGNLYNDGDTIRDGKFIDDKLVLNLDNSKIEIEFTQKNLAIIKEKGINLIGYGFILKKIKFSGPQLIKIEPTKIRKSNEIQKIKLYFTENPEELVEFINFKNLYYDLSENIECYYSKEENKGRDDDDGKICICEGIFNFTGEYQIYDNDNILLTREILKIEPNYNDDEDIINLIEDKIIFDSENVGINLNKKFFEDININSTIVIETHDLFNKDDYLNQKKLYFINDKKSNNIIKFDSTYVNMEINEKGEIIIPDGLQIVRIKVNEQYKEIQSKGLYIKGYGLSINTIFIDNNLPQY